MKSRRLALLRRKRYQVYYPEYFDAKLARSEGRRVPLSLADDEPHLKKLVAACEKLGLEYQSEPKKSYPRFWWNNSGRILVEIDKTNKIPKEETLKRIAERARKFKIKQKSQKTQPIDKPTKKDDDDKIKSKYTTKKNVSAKRKGTKKKSGKN